MADDCFDLLLKAGRVVCPASGLDAPGAIAIRGDRIVAVGDDVSGAARWTYDEPDGILLPGLIDLHAHPAKSGSVFGVDPDRHMLRRGTTTVLSQGDAGAANIDDYVRTTIAASATRIRLAVNLSSVGESTTAGCFARPEWIDVAACVAAARRHSEHVWGIAVNVSRHACDSTDPRRVLDSGLQAAEQAGLPLLYGMRPPEDWAFDDQLTRLRPGDVVTYCYRRTPHCIVTRGGVHPAIRAARQRGILFDVGHGTASFDFTVAEAALADGFPPDTISTDLQARHLTGGVAHDLPAVVSKMIAAGFPEREAFAAVTSGAAKAIGLAGEIGCLRPGACADVTLLKPSTSRHALKDAAGANRSGMTLCPALTIRAGTAVTVE